MYHVSAQGIDERMVNGLLNCCVRDQKFSRPEVRLNKTINVTVSVTSVTVRCMASPCEIDFESRSASETVRWWVKTFFLFFKSVNLSVLLLL